MNKPPRVVVTTSWDDGDPHDTKLAELLSAYNLQGTFYIPFVYGERQVIDFAGIRNISQNFEVGAHAWHHVILSELEDHQLDKEIGMCKTAIEDIIDKPVTMFSYPYGKCNWRVRQKVIDAGFLGARVTKSFHLNVGNDLWQIPTTIFAFRQSHLNLMLHLLAQRNWNGINLLAEIGFQKTWLLRAYALFNKVITEGGVWHLWGHSKQIEEYGLWDELEALFSLVARNPQVTYLSNGALVQSLKENSLCNKMSHSTEKTREDVSIK
jgi:peptidoglycan-N-acetylglucosamine deacetylase